MDHHIFDFIQSPEKYTFGIIKLNSEFSSEDDIKFFAKLWKQAEVRAAADGGSNVLHANVECSRTTSLPTFISGDFDSISPCVKKYYESKGVEIIPTPDQDETDFTKCLDILHNKCIASSLKLNFIAVHAGASMTRLDHILGNVNTMLKFSMQSDVLLFLILGDSISFILKQGVHNINVDCHLRGHWCSLVPIGGPCTSTTTTGLLYNMENTRMEFGGLISTCNGFDKSNFVSIRNSSTVLFSIGLTFKNSKNSHS